MNALTSFISHCDHSLMQCVHRWQAPRWVRIWVVAATRLGDGWLWYALAVLIVLFGGRNRFMAVGAAALSSAASRAIYHTVRRLSKRRRPFAVAPHCWSKLVPPDDLSFPSGHTLTGFAVAIPLAGCGKTGETSYALMF